MSQPETASRRHGERTSVAPASARGDGGVRIRDDGPIRIMTLARPAKQNAITLAMFTQLARALDAAAGDERVRVVLIESAEGAFCVGADHSGAAAEPEREALGHAENDFLQALASFPKAIVTAVNGLAAGVGAEIVLRSDMVVASPSAALKFVPPSHAVPIELLSSALLGERVGHQRASEWIMFGERIDAATLMHHGLLNAVVSLDELGSSARARAEALSRLAPSAVRDAKRLLRDSKPSPPMKRSDLPYGQRHT